MIGRGRAEGWLKLPISTLRPWAEFNGVEFNGISIGSVSGYEHRGSAVIADRELSGGDEGPLMVIPRDLVLSMETVENQAKSDQQLREMLDVLGDYAKTARGAILVFLLIQATIACPEVTKKPGVSNPFTEYVKFLPRELLPTFWTDEERELLIGTTLRPAVDAKLKSLRCEYENLRSATEKIGWCSNYWWDEEDGLIRFEDWLEVDSMYRSRALEFPGIGDAMVPCIDMANHASGEETIALYETDGQGSGLLLLRDGKHLKQGDEVTITYGDEKGACEMVFSYGFIEDSMQSAKEMFLDLTMPDDDPLGRAKMVVSKSAPGVRLVDKAGKFDWESDFVWLICVNEEDGLDFRVLQINDGERELKVFWKDEELLDILKLRSTLQKDALWDIFHLRAVSVIQDRVESQLQTLFSTEGLEHISHGDGTPVRDRPWALAMKLRKLESKLLERAYGDLEDQKTALLSSPTVRDYLQAAAPGESAEEEDFS